MPMVPCYVPLQFIPLDFFSENVTPLLWTPFWKLLCKSKSCRLQRESVTKARQAQIPPHRHFFWLRFSALKQSLIKDRKTRGKLLSRCAFLCRWCAAKENQKRLNYKNDQQSQTGWEIVRSDGSCSLQNNGTAWHVGKDEATSDGWQRLFEICWDWLIHAIMFEAFEEVTITHPFSGQSKPAGEPMLLTFLGKWTGNIPCQSAPWQPLKCFKEWHEFNAMLMSVLQWEAVLILYEWSLLGKTDLPWCLLLPQVCGHGLWIFAVSVTFCNCFLR